MHVLSRNKLFYNLYRSFVHNSEKTVTIQLFFKHYFPDFSEKRKMNVGLRRRRGGRRSVLPGRRGARPGLREGRLAGAAGQSSRRLSST